MRGGTKTSSIAEGRVGTTSDMFTREIEVYMGATGLG
jgi:hypothetical protein